MPAADTISTAIVFDRELHKRAKKLGKRIRKSFGSMCREGLREQVRLIESQLEEDARVHKHVKDVDRTERRLRELGEDTSLAPERATAPEADVVKSAVDSNRARANSIYTRHAALIAAALSDPNERRLRTLEAVREIMEATPLTHPGESQICEALETLVLERRAKEAAKVIAPTPAPPPPEPPLSSFLQRANAATRAARAGTNDVETQVRAVVAQRRERFPGKTEDDIDDE